MGTPRTLCRLQLLPLFFVLLANARSKDSMDCEEVGGDCVPEELAINCSKKLQLQGCKEDEVCCFPQKIHQRGTCGTTKPPKSCKKNYKGICQNECSGGRMHVGSCTDECKCCGCKIKDKCVKNKGFCVTDGTKCKGTLNYMWCDGNKCSCCIPAPGSCPDKWISNGRFCYFFSSDSLTYADSRTDCQRWGADLASILSGEEQNFVASNQIGLPWIGLNEIVTEGIYEWTDGSPVTYQIWSEGEPNNYGGDEDCCQMWTNDGWNDNNCNATFNYVCKKPKI